MTVEGEQHRLTIRNGALPRFHYQCAARGGAFPRVAVAVTVYGWAPVASVASRVRALLT